MNIPMVCIHFNCGNRSVCANECINEKNGAALTKRGDLSIHLILSRIILFHFLAKMEQNKMVNLKQMPFWLSKGDYPKKLIEGITAGSGGIMGSSEREKARKS